MYPVLFSIGPLSVTSYYIFWSAALFTMITWTRRRAASLYGIPYNDAGDVLLWMIFGVFMGAMLGGYLDHWTRYANSPEQILNFWESGVSSGPGFIGGGLAGIYKLRRIGRPVDSFADAAAIPCAFMLFIGRWGCFLNGCCLGIPTSLPLGVAYPFAPAVKAFPSQPLEAFAALGIGILLVFIERALRRDAERASHGAFLMPVFLVTYGTYRFFLDFMRAGDRILGLRLGQYTGVIACVVGVAWFVLSLKRAASLKRAGANLGK